METTSRQHASPDPAPGGTQPAAGLLQAALHPGSHLDFPQITELCARLEACPQEIPGAVAALTAVLREEKSPLTTKLKALTISNEGLYNARVVAAFRSAEGLREALATLREARGPEQGDVTAENVRMLATEVEKVCFCSAVEGRAAGLRPRLGSPQLERLEKARRRASEIFELSQQKAMRLVKKAEKAMDQTASMMIQEAEKRLGSAGLDGPSNDGGGGGGGGGAKESQHPRSKQWDALSLEEQQLQWALGASLAEFQGQTVGKAASTGESTVSSTAKPAPEKTGLGIGPACLAELHLSMAEVERRTARSKARAEELEGLLRETAGRLSDSGAEDVKLLCQLEDSGCKVEELTSQLAKISEDLEGATRRTEALEAEVAAAAETLVGLGPAAAEVAKQKLEAFIQECEKSLPKAAAGNSSTLQEMQKDLPVREKVPTAAALPGPPQSTEAEGDQREDEDKSGIVRKPAVEELTAEESVGEVKVEQAASEGTTADQRPGDRAEVEEEDKSGGVRKPAVEEVIAEESVGEMKVEQAASEGTTADQRPGSRAEVEEEGKLPAEQKEVEHQVDEEPAQNAKEDLTAEQGDGEKLHTHEAKEDFQAEQKEGEKAQVQKDQEEHSPAERNEGEERAQEEVVSDALVVHTDDRSASLDPHAEVETPMDAPRGAAEVEQQTSQEEELPQRAGTCSPNEEQLR